MATVMCSCFISLTPNCVVFGRTQVLSTPSNFLYFKNGTKMISSIKACLPSDDKVHILRPPGTAGYHPSIWDGHFLSSSSTSLKPYRVAGGRIEELKKEVKSLLSLASNDLFQELNLIDKIQRLGVAYHFEEEIQDKLLQIYNDQIHLLDHEVDECRDLHTIALRFRLLRQTGYYVSPDVFNKFKDGKGKFHPKLTEDLHCMLSLYQASYLGFIGEHTMDEAMEFTTRHLKSVVSKLSSPLATEVQHALAIPLQKSIARVEARNYISTYQADESRNESLLELAKLDYNNVQLLHQQELTVVKRWWDNMNIKSKVPFETKDRVVEGFAIVTTIYYEPQYSFARMLMAKFHAILTVLDDAFDVYGNLDELAPLIDAFQRWDVGVVNGSPEHIKIIFKEVVNVINQMDIETITKGQSNGLPFLRKEVKDYTIGLWNEAKIMFSGEVPTLEEWLPISVVTVALNIFIVSAVMDLGETATKEVFDWVASKPKIIRCAYLICRLFDDLGSFKLEHERGITLSSITCCMKDQGITESEAIEHIQSMISTAWKDMNQELLMANSMPMSVLKIVFNLARIMELYFAVGHDGYANSKGRTQDIVTMLFIDSIPI